jgi:hypothetical protein
MTAFSCGYKSKTNSTGWSQSGLIEPLLAIADPILQQATICSCGTLRVGARLRISAPMIRKFN